MKISFSTAKAYERDNVFVFMIPSIIIRYAVDYSGRIGHSKDVISFDLCFLFWYATMELTFQKK